MPDDGVTAETFYFNLKNKITIYICNFKYDRSLKQVVFDTEYIRTVVILERQVFDNKDLTAKTKIIAHKAAIIPSLLYDCETWAVHR